MPPRSMAQLCAVVPQRLPDSELQHLMLTLLNRLSAEEKEYVRLTTEDAMPHRLACAKAGLDPYQPVKRAVTACYEATREARRRAALVDKLWIEENMLDVFRQAMAANDFKTARACLLDLTMLSGNLPAQQLQIEAKIHTHHTQITAEDMEKLSRLHAVIEGEVVEA